MLITIVSIVIIVLSAGLLGWFVFGRYVRGFRFSEAIALRVLDTIPDGVVLCDLSGEIRAVNDSLAGMLGVAARDLQGKHLSTVLANHEVIRDLVAETGFSRGLVREDMDSLLLSETEGVIPVSVSVSMLSDTSRKSGRTGFVLVVTDISERKRTMRKLNFMAYHDSLTGLLNRESFYETLKNTQYNILRGAESNAALMYLDIDFFREVNESYGHETGDELLKEVGNRVNQCIRRSDYAFRISGDEFAIILTSMTNDTDAAWVAEKLLSLISTPITLSGHMLRLTVSIGIDLVPNEERNIDELVGRANQALEEAKQKRNAFRFFSSDMQNRSLKKIHTISNLRGAIENSDLVTVFQPQMGRDGHIRGAEALLRWNSGIDGFINPDTFIPLAEETGLIVPLGKQVLFNACRQAVRCQELGLEDFVISVNLSGRQLAEEDLLDTVLNILEVTGLRPNRLELEITETTLMKDHARSVEVLTALRANGTMIAIDDFGTGYSSFGQLGNLPVDSVKIDKSFIRNMMRDTRIGSIVKAIVDMSHGLGLQTIAEGVEDSSQEMRLMEMGCDFYQGFHYSKGVNAEKLMDFVAQVTGKATGENPLDVVYPE